MNIDKALEIANKLGLNIRGYYDESGSTPQDLYSFANEIARIEREECAELCDDIAHKYIGEEGPMACNDAAMLIRLKA